MNPHYIRNYIGNSKAKKVIEDFPLPIQIEFSNGSGKSVKLYKVDEHGHQQLFQVLASEEWENSHVPLPYT